MVKVTTTVCNLKWWSAVGGEAGTGVRYVTQRVFLSFIYGLDKNHNDGRQIRGEQAQSRIHQW